MDFLAFWVSLPIVVLSVLFVIMWRAFMREQGERSPREPLLPEKYVWGLSIFLAFVFLMAGFSKLVDYNTFVRAFTYWHYSHSFMVEVGVVEMVCGALLLFPATASIATVPLMIEMGGAMYTHIHAGQWALLPLPAIALLGLLWLFWDRFPYHAVSRRRRHPGPPTQTPA